MTTDRHMCTADDPWTPEKSKRACHPSAEEMGGDQRDGYPAGDLQDYRCPHCGHEWTSELPQ